MHHLNTVVLASRTCFPSKGNLAIAQTDARAFDLHLPQITAFGGGVPATGTQRLSAP